MNLLELKKDFLERYHAHLQAAVHLIETTSGTHQNRAKQVNKSINEYRKTIIADIQSTFVSSNDKQQGFLVLQYCTSVISLEYRHRVWPYEYMALSRRVGELWERFCSTA